MTVIIVTHSYTTFSQPLFLLLKLFFPEVSFLLLCHFFVCLTEFNSGCLHEHRWRDTYFAHGTVDNSSYRTEKSDSLFLLITYQFPSCYLLIH